LDLSDPRDKAAPDRSISALTRCVPIGAGGGVAIVKFGTGQRLLASRHTSGDKVP